MEQTTPTGLFELHIDAPSSAHLNEAAKWGKFLAIVGFVMCGLIALAALFAGSFISAMFRSSGMDSGMAGSSAMGGAFFTIIYLLGALLYFFPCLFLYRFSAKMKTALRTDDQQLLTDSFKNLKACLRFLGIVTIIVLSFYVLAIIAMVVGLAAGAGR